MHMQKDRRGISYKTVSMAIMLPVLLAGGALFVNKLYADIDKKVDRTEFEATIQAMFKNTEDIKASQKEMREILHNHEVKTIERFDVISRGQNVRQK